MIRTQRRPGPPARPGYVKPACVRPGDVVRHALLPDQASGHTEPGRGLVLATRVMHEFPGDTIVDLLVLSATGTSWVSARRPVHVLCEATP